MNHFSSPVTLAGCLVFSLCVGVIVHAQDPELRTWWSQNGSESIDATFESFDKKSRIVSLRDQDDELIEVKITLLCPADRKYVARTARKKEKVFKKVGASDMKSEPVAVAKKKKTEPRRKKARVVKKYGINWVSNVDSACEIASEEGVRKPVMLFRVLGDLNGFM